MAVLLHRLKTSAWPTLVNLRSLAFFVFGIHWLGRIVSKQFKTYFLEENMRISTYPFRVCHVMVIFQKKTFRWEITWFHSPNWWLYYTIPPYWVPRCTQHHATMLGHAINQSSTKSGMNKLKINDHNLVDTVSQRVRLHKRVFCHLSICHCQKY